MNVRKDDTVIVLSGRDKGKEGKVLNVDPKNQKVVIEGVSVAKVHQRPRKEGEEGGIIKKETPIYACKVMRVCPKCHKPTKEAHGTGKDGNKVRICKACGEEI